MAEYPRQKQPGLAKIRYLTSKGDLLGGKPRKFSQEWGNPVFSKGEKFPREFAPMVFSTRNLRAPGGISWGKPPKGG